MVDFRVRIQLPVAWGDMDAFQHVNNTVFFRYFEIARIEFLTAVGFSRTASLERVGPILHSTGARFRRPLRYPDTIWTGVRVRRVEEDRLELDHRVVSQRQEAVVAEGPGVVVAFDYREWRKVRLPDEVRRAIEAQLVGS